MRLSREEILAVYEEGPNAVVQLVEFLMDTIDKQSDQIAMMSERIAELEKRVKTLEGQLKLNSRNSSKPPSSDGFKKPPVKRKKTGKPPGGQKGHKGHTLMMAEDPDWEITYPVTECEFCGRSLERVEPAGYERRQVFDLPPIGTEVTEHRCERKLCPRCGCETKAAFPEDITQPVQYGPRIKAIAVYINQYQLIPYGRTGEALSDLFGCDISEGTLVNWTSAASEILRPVEDEIKSQLTRCPVGNFDETGMPVEGKGVWLHVSSNESLTHYGVHPKRGREAMEDIGILPNFRGTAVHDRWSPYFTYPCSHALCNAHILRDLTFLEEEEGEKWAGKMKKLLGIANAAVNERKAKGLESLSRSQRKNFEKRYERILAQGFAANPLPDIRGQPGKRGRRKKTKVRNLLECLRDRRCEVLKFMGDFPVPFDNNLAERDLRMAKLKQKISGTFRSWDGAYDFCRIRGYISTARKNSVPVIQALAAAFEGKPFIPVPIEP